MADIIETFESENIIGFSGNWERSTVTPNSGSYCYKSNVNWETSLLVKTGDEGGRITFSYRVSSEQNKNYFYFDNTGSRMFKVSGEIGWTQVSYDLDEGTHFLTWGYIKNSDNVVGEDAAYIDDLTITNSAVISRVNPNFNVDTKRIVGQATAIIPNVSVDTCRRLVAPITVIPFATDTCRKRMATLPVFQSIQLQLESKTLTDKFTIVTPANIVKNQRFTGIIKDFSFIFVAEERSTQKQMTTVSGVYDVQDLIDKYISFNNVSSYQQMNTAIVVIQKVCTAMGKTPNILIDNFHTINFKSAKITAQDIFSQMLGWTDKVPTRLVNIFLRGDTLYAIQRGMEIGVVEIVKYNSDTVSKKTMDLLQNPTDTHNISMPDKITGADSDDDDEDGQYRNDTVTLGDVTITYSNGLVVREVHGDSQTTYTYSGSVPKNVIKTGQTTTNADGKIVIIYESDGDGNLIREEEKTYDTSETLQKTRTTRHFPLGFGDWGTVVEEDGKTVSNAVSQGAPSAKVTPYEAKIAKQEWKVEIGGGVPVVVLPARVKDYIGELPMTAASDVQKVGNDILALNGKTEERVTLDVYDEHIFDFTSRIRWNGNEYYLEHNQVTLAAKEYRQQIEMVRWYDE